MKNILTLLMLMAFTLGVSAQFTIIDFESASDRAVWNGFANNPDAPEDLIIVDNPDKSGLNTSDSVLMYTVNATGDQWVGAWTDAYGPIVISEDYHILTMMVYKTIISPCCLKVEASTNGGPTTELKSPNTVTDQWELISIDFSACIGYSYPRLVIFPDFPDEARTGGTIAYIDNITVTSPTAVRQISGPSISIFPNPADEVMHVQCPDMKGLIISDLIGKTVKTYKFPATSSKSVEVNDLHTGVYFISVETGNGSYTSKFMKR